MTPKRRAETWRKLQAEIATAKDQARQAIRTAEMATEAAAAAAKLVEQLMSDERPTKSAAATEEELRFTRV